MKPTIHIENAICKTLCDGLGVIFGPYFPAIYVQRDTSTGKYRVEIYESQHDKPDWSCDYIDVFNAFIGFRTFLMDNTQLDDPFWCTRFCQDTEFFRLKLLVDEGFRVTWENSLFVCIDDVDEVPYVGLYLSDAPIEEQDQRKLDGDREWTCKTTNEAVGRFQKLRDNLEEMCKKTEQDGPNS